MPRTDDFFDEPDFEPTNEPWDFPLERVRKRRKIALSSTLVVLFFAGAAFTAGAGDLAANRLQADDPCAQQANAAVPADPACVSRRSAPTTDAAVPAPALDPAPAPTPAPADAAPPADAAVPAQAPAPAGTEAAPPVDPVALPDATPDVATLGSTARAAATPATTTATPDAQPAPTTAPSDGAGP